MALRASNTYHRLLGPGQKTACPWLLMNLSSSRLPTAGSTTTICPPTSISQRISRRIATAQPPRPTALKTLSYTASTSCLRSSQEEIEGRIRLSRRRTHLGKSARGACFPIRSPGKLFFLYNRRRYALRRARHRKTCPVYRSLRYIGRQHKNARWYATVASS